MIIPSFAPVLDIPYYYPCNFPLIHEVLHRQGSITSLALLAASRLYSLPSCGDNGLVKPYFHKLDYVEPIWEMYGQRQLDSFEEGKAGDQAAYRRRWAFFGYRNQLSSALL
ncbi:hypothetical protein Q0F98_22700 [Paenibacillus amylolyticus]|nr:hypothetical protein Q0F98_22700 [Paenibacillus amylolyticus]